MCLISLGDSEGHQEVTLIPSAKLWVMLRCQQPIITAGLDSHGAVVPLGGLAVSVRPGS